MKKFHLGNKYYSELCLHRSNIFCNVIKSSVAIYFLLCHDINCILFRNYIKILKLCTGDTATLIIPVNSSVFHFVYLDRNKINFFRTKCSNAL